MSENQETQEEILANFQVRIFKEKFTKIYIKWVNCCVCMLSIDNDYVLWNKVFNYSNSQSFVNQFFLFNFRLFYCVGLCENSHRFHHKKFHWCVIFIQPNPLIIWWQLQLWIYFSWVFPIAVPFIFFVFSFV